MNKETIAQQYLEYLDNKNFPCIAAKAALARQQVHTFVAPHMACPADDFAILQFLYSFIDEYRSSDQLYHTAAIIFEQPTMTTEAEFEQLFWQRLQSISNLDAKNYHYDSRVDPDPSSEDFSFSLKEEAFFIIALHPNSSRQTRRFAHPAIVFNPHQQFEHLRLTSKYDNMKQSIRKRDVALSGSVNPMLRDFGEASEVYQYSGREYDQQWKCPLKINHARA